MSPLYTRSRRLAEKFDANQIILSCRSAAYQYVFERFSDVEIAEFDEHQVHSFVRNWFSQDIDRSVECARALKDERNKRIRELASSPLLLTMLCLTFADTLTFPRNRSELYKEGVDILLRKWDASRNIRRHELYRDLSLKKKEILLSQIAYRSFSDRQLFMPEQMLVRYVAEFCANLPGLQRDDIPVDALAIVKTIDLQHGLIVERAKGVYAFSHLTFQEYFTARYLVDNEARGQLVRAFKDHFLDDFWREVVLLTSGMVANADNIVLLLRESVATLATAKVVELLSMLDATLFEECYSVSVAKAFLLADVFNRSERLCLLAGAIAVSVRTRVIVSIHL